MSLSIRGTRLFKQINVFFPTTKKKKDFLCYLLYSRASYLLTLDITETILRKNMIHGSLSRDRQRHLLAL